MASISLGQVRANAEYNLSELYDEYMTPDDTIDDNDISPFQYVDSSCDYYTPDQFGIMTNSLQPHNLSAFCINCQSITANWDNFNSLLLNTTTDTFAFDIIGITETFKIHSNINYDIPGYHPLIFNTRTGSSSGRGGVGMHIKDHLNFKHRPDISVFIPHIFESIFIEIQSKHTNVIIGTIYRPNTSPKADLDIFQNTLSELMHTIKHENKNVVIMGDFSIDLLKF